MSREYSTNPRFEDNGDIGSCDTYSDVTKNKVTAITSEKVGMSTDHSNSVSTEADRLNGKNVESPTTKLLCGRRSRFNSMDASKTTRSTNKPNEMETCLPHDVRSPALKDAEDNSAPPSLVDPSLSKDVSVNKQQFKMEKPPTKQNSSRPVPKDSHFNSCEDDSTNDEQNCLLIGSKNVTTPPSSSLKSSSSPMLPTCTGQPQTIDTEEANLMSPCSTAPITSHDSKIPKLMDVQISLLSCSKKSANKDSSVVVKGSTPSEIVDDTGCVSSLNLFQGKEKQYLFNVNATVTNDAEYGLIGDDNDASTCLASKLESTSRSLAAKHVNSMTMANMSDYLSQQFIANSNDDTNTDLAAVASFNDSSYDESVNLPAKTSHLQNGQNDDNLEKKANEEIKYDAPKNDNYQRDEKSLPTVIDRSNFVSLTNQYLNTTHNTDAFSTLKNLNDTSINDVAISADADKSRNATDATNATLNRATAVAPEDVSSNDDVLSCKVNDREIGANPPSAIFLDVVGPINTVDAELLANNGTKVGGINGTSENAVNATNLANQMEKSGSSKDIGSNARYSNGSSNDNLWPGNKLMNGAPADQSKMKDNLSLLRSNNHDNMNDTEVVNEKLKTITTSYNGAKHSLSKDVKICQMAAKSITYKGNHRGAGWGTPVGLGLRGGGETSIANGASGWGPPPQPNTSVARGWGQPPATNSPTSNGTSAWGNAGGTASSSAEEPNGPNGNINKTPGAVSSGVISANASQAPGGPTTQNSAPPPSWAAAAGKGLPNNDNSSSSGSGQSGSGPSQSSTSKHLESLQSVREALFSQDGWGGDNVKQDNAWDIDGKSSTAASSVPEASQGGAKKEPAGAAPSSSNMPTVAPRNDGTDLWKSTLSGQPPAPKPQQQTSAWNHTPQNPTDYKNWGEDESDNNGAASNGPIGSQAPVAQNTSTASHGGPFGSTGQNNAPGRSEGNNFWGNDGSNGPQYNAPSKPKDDWSVAPGVNNSGWGEPRRDGPGGAIGTRNGTDVNSVGRNDQGSWNTPAPIRPSGSGPSGNQWNSGIPPPSRGAAGWDHDSPPISRRDDGTSYWGREKPPGAPGAPPVGTGMGGVSGWKDMPTPNNIGMRGPPGPPGPAGPRMPPGKDPWGQPPTRPWGDPSDVNPGGAGPIGSNPSNVGWGDGDLLKRDSSVTGWGDAPRNASQWNSGQRNVNPPLRGSPDWEGPGNSGMDMPGQGGPSGWNNPIKPVGPKKATPEMIWASKQFRMLCEMGCSKTDAEAALKSTNLNLEDALEMLKSHGRLPMGGPSPWSEPPIGPPGNDFSNNPYNKGPSFRGPNLGPSGQGAFGPNQEVLGMNNQPNMPGNQNMPSNYNHLPLMGKQPNGMPPGPNNSGLSAPVGPPLGPTGVRPPTGGPSGSNQPSAQQLKLLVQQIQMAVQAGHLNPQILNQPLAPQTLVLLNQLLQQIKNLTNHQNILNQQKSMGNSNTLLSVSVDITKTKQEIQNLQNQISAQQATYLKSQGMPPMPPQQSGNSGLQGSDTKLPDMFGNLSMSNPNTSTTEAPGKSKFLPFINTNNDYSKTPGTTGSTSNSSKTSALGSNTWGNDTWGALSPNDPTSSTGWPDSAGQNSKPQSQNTNLQQPNSSSGANSTSNATNGIKDTDFGIPEFQPGKPWKGMQDPTEDPNLTPGSVNMTTMESNPLSKTSSSNSLAIASTATSAISSSSAMDTFGPNSTWSFGNNKNDLTISTSSSSNTTKSDSVSGGTWGNGPITSAPTGGSVTGLNTSNLTPMGQDLWGKSAIGRTPPGLPGSNSNSSWPTSNGWSSGHNGNNDGGNQSAWLLLKNVTPQIDGSTLKTLCLQHGPLKDFKLYANQGVALVQYAASREANKAQKALNNCPLGNTTIQAMAITDGDAINILTNMGDRNQTLTPTRGNTPSSNGMISSASTLVGSSLGLAKTSSAGDMWGTNISSANSLFGSTSTTTGSSTSAVWGMHGTSDLLDQERTTPQLPFLPTNLLGENNL